MADYKVHLLQAHHNAEVANKLVQEQPYHDWGITAAFYAAIHYFECWLFNKPEKHTETSIPTDRDGRLKYSPHGWREKIIEQQLDKEGFTDFRILKEASETARYLSLYHVRPGLIFPTLDKPASEHFKPEDAKEMVQKKLPSFKNKLGIV